jgi:hypothetical protein
MISPAAILFTTSGSSAYTLMSGVSSAKGGRWTRYLDAPWTTCIVDMLSLALGAAWRIDFHRVNHLSSTVIQYSWLEMVG